MMRLLSFNVLITTEIICLTIEDRLPNSNASFSRVLKKLLLHPEVSFAVMQQISTPVCTHHHTDHLLLTSFPVQLQRELNTRQVEGIDVKDGTSSTRGVFSPQDGAPRSPRSLRSPCTSSPIPAPPVRSHSDSEAMLEEQGAAMRLKGPTENLFLDALSLDPLGGLEVPPSSGLESEKRFPCMKEVTLTNKK